jgi:hypothetical protein
MWNGAEWSTKLLRLCILSVAVALPPRRANRP